MKIPTIVSLVILSLAFWLTPVHGYESTEITLHPIADSYVDSLNPSNNYGGSSSLFAMYNVEGDFQRIENAYLMFDLASLPQGTTVESATLIIYLFDVSSTMKVYLHFCQDVSWEELEINWRNAPRYVDKPVSMTLMARSMEFYSMDATEAVKQALSKDLGRVTLVVTTELKTGLLEGIQFVSRETTLEEYWPKLKIIYSVGALTTRTATELKRETVEVPVSTATLVRTLQVTATETITRMETIKELVYATVTNRVGAPSPSFIIIAFAAGLALGILVTRLVRYGRLEAKPPLEGTLKISPDAKTCPSCGGKLNPLGATGKSICSSCGRIYE